MNSTAETLTITEAVERVEVQRQNLRQQANEFREQLSDKREEVVARDAVLWGWQRRRLNKRS